MFHYFIFFFKFIRRINTDNIHHQLHRGNTDNTHHPHNSSGMRNTFKMNRLCAFEFDRFPPCHNYCWEDTFMISHVFYTSPSEIMRLCCHFVLYMLLISDFLREQLYSNSLTRSNVKTCFDTCTARVISVENFFVLTLFCSYRQSPYAYYQTAAYAANFPPLGNPSPQHTYFQNSTFSQQQQQQHALSPQNSTLPKSITPTKRPREDHTLSTGRVTRFKTAPSFAQK